MSNRVALKNRVMPTYTKGEEIFNMVSHIVGGAWGIIALVVCSLISIAQKDTVGLVCGAVFGVSTILLYTMSSIYHGLRQNMAKRVFQIIDHCTIYLLIAGTYTPMLVCGLAPKYPLEAWITFGAGWGLAILATTLTAIDLKKYRHFSMACYVGMGWSIIFSITKMYRSVTPACFWLLLGGGILYTVGAVFYNVGKKKKYFHSIFHLFTLAGTIAQSLSVFMVLMQ